MPFFLQREFRELLKQFTVEVPTHMVHLFIPNRLMSEICPAPPPAETYCVVLKTN